MSLGIFTHGYFDDNAVVEGAPAPETDPAVIFDFVPAANGTLAFGPATPISFKVTAPNNDITAVFVVARFPSMKVSEIVYDSTGFGLGYSNNVNQRVGIENGFQFTMLRDGGWSQPPDLRVFAFTGGVLVELL